MVDLHTVTPPRSVAKAVAAHVSLAALSGVVLIAGVSLTALLGREAYRSLPVEPQGVFPSGWPYMAAIQLPLTRDIAVALTVLVACVVVGYLVWTQGRRAPALKGFVSERRTTYSPQSVIVLIVAGLAIGYVALMGLAYGAQAGAAIVLAFARLCLRYNFVACLLPVVLFMRRMLSAHVRQRMSWKVLREDWLKLQSSAWFFASGGMGLVGLGKYELPDGTPLIRVQDLGQLPQAAMIACYVIVAVLYVIAAMVVHRGHGESGEESREPPHLFAAACWFAWLSNVVACTLFFNSTLLLFYTLSLAPPPSTG